MSNISEQAFHWESDQENGVRVSGGGVGEDGSTTATRACLSEWDCYRGGPEETQWGILCHTAVSTVCQGMPSMSKFVSMSLPEWSKCNSAACSVYVSLTLIEVLTIHFIVTWFQQIINK